ncbi:MAG: hypothetical protein PVF54_11195, partial [Anaerolineae bacterium]
GPSPTLPFWKYEESLIQEDIPSNLLSWEQPAAFASENDLAWAAVDPETAERRLNLLGDYFSLEGMDLELRRPPPGWTLVRKFPGSTCDWHVFRISQK